MEHYFHLAVKFAAAGYILYKVWLLLFRDRLFGLWDRIPVRAPRAKSEAKPSATARKGAVGVVGRTNGGYLADPAPVLEPVPVIPVEPEADGATDNGPDEEFEVGPAMGRPSDEELYGAGNEQLPVTDVSTGSTYEELFAALAYVTAPVDDDEIMMRTAETFSRIRGAVSLDAVGRDENCIALVDRVLAECLDANGERLPKRKGSIGEKELASFSVAKYI